MAGNVKRASGYILFASDDSEQSIIDARQYCKDKGYGPDMVRIVKREGQVLVVVR
jgi:hypothetical protein